MARSKLILDGVGLSSPECIRGRVEGLSKKPRHEESRRKADRQATEKRKRESGSPGKWENPTPSVAVNRLGTLSPDVLGPIEVILIKTPVPLLALSIDIAQQLDFKRKLPDATKKADQAVRRTDKADIERHPDTLEPYRNSPLCARKFPEDDRMWNSGFRMAHICL